MMMKRKLAKLAMRWPVYVVVLGIGLTLLWIAIIVWFPLRLFL
jgi:hypothetical protein